jgi:hypothetical protein
MRHLLMVVGKKKKKREGEQKDNVQKKKEVMNRADQKVILTEPSFLECFLFLRQSESRNQSSSGDSGRGRSMRGWPDTKSNPIGDHHQVGRCFLFLRQSESRNQSSRLSAGRDEDF